MAADDFIPRSNIKRFEQKLRTATDEAERKVLRDLLAAERQILRAARRPEISWHKGNTGEEACGGPVEQA